MSDISEAVISQSVRDSGSPYQSISNLQLSGISTLSDTMNSDDGILYGSFTKSGATYTLKLYKDAMKESEVARATSTSLGVVDVSAQNSSGLSGTVNIIGWVSDDTSIRITLFLATDRDLPQRGLSSLCDYDTVNGFAHYHIQAWNYLKSHIIGRYKSIIWNPNFIDTAQINGGVGGYDLGKCINLHTLKECAAHYAFARISERQSTDPTSNWWLRQQESKKEVNAFLKTLELRFDTNQDRVEDKSRSFGVHKISRA